METIVSASILPGGVECERAFEGCRRDPFSDSSWKDDCCLIGLAALAALARTTIGAMTHAVSRMMLAHYCERLMLVLDK